MADGVYSYLGAGAKKSYSTLYSLDARRIAVIECFSHGFSCVVVRECKSIKQYSDIRTLSS